MRVRLFCRVFRSTIVHVHRYRSDPPLQRVALAETVPYAKHRSRFRIRLPKELILNHNESNAAASTISVTLSRETPNDSRRALHLFSLLSFDCDEQENWGTQSRN